MGHSRGTLGSPCAHLLIDVHVSPASVLQIQTMCSFSKVFLDLVCTNSSPKDQELPTVLLY